ncbi:MAG: ABC transporter ATP-binding protein [Candidatus Moranbacteria bacterium]|nr:ABC transporter ATP-binding protein [Candidatus Moranbacteria bacterium]NTW46399.1 ABC transporter ATP-binding protein [Candidatus Moranbacteria bacterium]
MEPSVGRTERKDVAIRVENVKKSFTVGENDIPVLTGVSLEIRRGDFALLVGPSGCGKSTLLHIIYGLEQPSEGAVFIDGKDIWSHSKDWRADFRNQSVGFIPQQSFWIKSLSVIENIAIPAVIGGKTFHESIPRAAKLIELVGMGKWADYRPYDLSGGQQQRISVARSLMLDPKFIIADEPTGNLDFKAGQEILRLMNDVCAEFGITVIMVTHNVEQYKYGSRIVRMRDGKIESDEENMNSYMRLKKEFPDAKLVEEFGEEHA